MEAHNNPELKQFEETLKSHPRAAAGMLEYGLMNDITATAARQRFNAAMEQFATWLCEGMSDLAQAGSPVEVSPPPRSEVLPRVGLTNPLISSFAEPADLTLHHPQAPTNPGPTAG